MGDYIAIHTKCFKNAGFACKSGMYVCNECADNVESRYTPFPSTEISDHSDKFYDNNACEDMMIKSYSTMLSNCQRYNKTELVNAIQHLECDGKSPSKNLLSSFFYNIDGNATNFDQFLVELKQLDHSFHVIGLAETNVDSPLQDLYQIPNYTSYYQSTLEGKTKGTGVALYFSDNLNVEILDKISYCNPDIESLFAEVTTASGGKLVYGVLYRPPNGSSDRFFETFDTIMSQLKGKKVHLLGDFNSDLLSSAPNTQLFEDVVYRNGLYPTISIATHFRQHCKSSCIDNILTNDIDNVLMSGVIEERIGDHSPLRDLTAGHKSDYASLLDTCRTGDSG